MENMKEMMDVMNSLAKAASGVFIDIACAKNLVDEGKEVLCSRKLQAALTKYQVLEKEMLDFFEKHGTMEQDNANVVDKSS